MKSPIGPEALTRVFDLGFRVASEVTKSVRESVMTISPSVCRYSVDGKVALVTGGGNGIGLALGRQLLDRGATVVLLDHDETALTSARTALGTQRLVTLKADVRDRTLMMTAMRQLIEQCGRLDIAVANAGVTPPMATLRMLAPEQFDRVIDTNLTGVFNTVQAAVDQVIKHCGHIVVVSSAAAFAPGLGGSPYMISKAGVEQLGRALRIELAAHGATAGVAYLGIVDTAMTAAVFDDDPLGGWLEQLLPASLRRRISADDAASAIVDGIGRRSAYTLAPAAWQPYSLLRGVVNIFLDRYLARLRASHSFVHELERRAEGGATSNSR